MVPGPLVAGQTRVTATHLAVKYNISDCDLSWLNFTPGYHILVTKMNLAITLAKFQTLLSRLGFSQLDN